MLGFPNYIDNMFVEIPDRGLCKIANFYVGIEGSISRSNSKVEIIQHTAKRDKATQKNPELKLIKPGGDLASYNHSIEQNTVALYERLQFRKATCNNGKRGTSQQFYSLLVKLYGQLVDGENVLIAFVESSPIIVRGRSPGHYAQQDNNNNENSSNGNNRNKILTPTSKSNRRNKRSLNELTPPSSSNASPNGSHIKYQNHSYYNNNNYGFNQNQDLYNSNMGKNETSYTPENSMINSNHQSPISPISPMNYQNTNQNSPTNPTNFTYDNTSKSFYNTSQPSSTNYSNTNQRQQSSSYTYSYSNNPSAYGNNKNNNYNSNNYQDNNYGNGYNGQSNYEGNQNMSTTYNNNNNNNSNNNNNNNNNQNGFAMNQVQNQNGSTFYNSQGQNQNQDNYSTFQPIYNTQNNQQGATTTVSFFNNNMNMNQQGNYNTYPAQSQTYQIQSQYQQSTNNSGQQFTGTTINNGK